MSPAQHHRQVAKRKIKRDNLFSILTACCDGADYIDRWAECIAKQTYRPIEVVFIDDNSKDASWKNVERKKPYFKEHNILISRFRHPKMKIYYGGALRYAVRKAQGRFFGTYDMDDDLLPHAISHVMELYKKNPKIGHIYTQFKVYNCKMKFIKRGFCRAPDTGESILSLGLKYGEHVYSHFRTFSKRIPGWIDIFPKRGKYAVDQYMGLSLEQLGYGMFTDSVCYHYRSGCKNSISAQFGSQRREYWHKIMQNFYKERRRNGIKPFPIIGQNNETLH